MNGTELSELCDVKAHVRRELVDLKLLEGRGRRGYGERDVVELAAIKKLRAQGSDARAKDAWRELREAIVEQVLGSSSRVWVVIPQDRIRAASVATTGAQVAAQVQDVSPLVVVEVKEPVRHALSRYRELLRRHERAGRSPDRR